MVPVQSISWSSHSCHQQRKEQSAHSLQINRDLLPGLWCYDGNNIYYSMPAHNCWLVVLKVRIARCNSHLRAQCTYSPLVLLLCSSGYFWSGAELLSVWVLLAGGWCIKGNLNAKAPRDVLGNNVQWFHSQGIYYGHSYS